MYNEGPIVDLINSRFDDLNHLVREMKSEIKAEIQSMKLSAEKKGSRLDSLELSREKYNWTIAMITAVASGLAVIGSKVLDLLIKWIT